MSVTKLIKFYTQLSEVIEKTIYLMSLKSFKNVFILSPHTDDGELGAGGTISKLNELGANILLFCIFHSREICAKGV